MQRLIGVRHGDGTRVEYVYDAHGNMAIRRRAGGLIAGHGQVVGIDAELGEDDRDDQVNAALLELAVERDFGVEPFGGLADVLAARFALRVRGGPCGRGGRGAGQNACERRGDERGPAGER
jgi:YD repeat-containing protein